MRLEHLKGKSLPIKRKDMGIAGAVIVLSQLISSFQSANTVSNEISKFKDEFQQSNLDREHYFVRKTDISPLYDKLDKINDQMASLDKKVTSLKVLVKENSIFDEAGLIGCSSTVKTSRFKFGNIKKGSCI